MCLAGGMGAKIEGCPDDIPSFAFLFGEDQGRYLIAVPEARAGEIFEAAKSAKVTIRIIGSTGGDSLTFGENIAIPLPDLASKYGEWFAQFMDG